MRSNATTCSQYLGLDIYSGDMLVDWDVYEAVLTPGDLAPHAGLAKLLGTGVF